jgi:hypothetical protein
MNNPIPLEYLGVAVRPIARRKRRRAGRTTPMHLAQSRQSRMDFGQRSTGLVKRPRDDDRIDR